MRQLFEAISQLRELEPTFVSVTYGAGGSVRARTVDLVTRIRRELDIEPVAHLTCVDATMSDLHAILEELRAAGIDNVLALRGDPPEGIERFTASEGGLAHGSDLIELITARYPFSVGAACYPEKHPESADTDEDVRSALRKENAGASYLITNLFFDNRFYFDFITRARAAGVYHPDHPGDHAGDQRRPRSGGSRQRSAPRFPRRCWTRCAHARTIPTRCSSSAWRGRPSRRASARRGCGRASTSSP